MDNWGVVTQVWHVQCKRLTRSSRNHCQDGKNLFQTTIGRNLPTLTGHFWGTQSTNGAIDHSFFLDFWLKWHCFLCSLSWISDAPCGRRGVMHPWFDFSFQRYIVCLFISYTSPLIFFLHFFLSYLLPYLSFPLKIDPLYFQATCRKRRLNLGLVFVFILCCSTFLLIGECVLLLC